MTWFIFRALLSRCEQLLRARRETRPTTIVCFGRPCKIAKISLGICGKISSLLRNELPFLFIFQLSRCSCRDTALATACMLMPCARQHWRLGRSDPWSRPVAFVRPLPSQDRRLSQGKSPDHDNVVVVRLFPQMFTSISIALQIPSTVPPAHYSSACPRDFCEADERCR